MDRKALAVIVLIVAIVGVARAITISTVDICVDSQPLSGLFSQIISELQQIKGKLPQVSRDGAEICEPMLYHKIKEGLAYSVSHRFEGVSAGSNVSMYFSVPYDSTTVSIVAIEVVTTGQGKIDIYRYPTVVAGGTQITPINLNFGSNNTSDVIVGYGYTVDLTNATLALQTVAPGGIKINAIGSLSEVGERVLLPPGNSFIIIYTNTQTTASEDVSIRIIWTEELSAS